MRFGPVAQIRSSKSEINGFLKTGNGMNDCGIRHQDGRCLQRRRRGMFIVNTVEINKLRRSGTIEQLSAPDKHVAPTELVILSSHIAINMSLLWSFFPFTLSTENTR